MRPFICLFIPAVLTLAQNQNLLNNPSFEAGNETAAAGWQWNGERAGATCEVDRHTARSGKASICLKNPSARKPHIYGTLWQDVNVHPNKRYTLSCYVRTEAGGIAWIGGGQKWQYRFPFPVKTEGWQRVAGSFATVGEETRFTVRILVESETEGLWVDDVKLEEGGGPTDFVYEPPLEPGEVRLRVFPFDPGENLVPNPSFEQVDEVRPKNWMWDRRNTDAQMLIERDGAHSGEVCVKFTNGTPFGAHVYGWFGMVGGVPVKPGTSYTLSAFVRSGTTAGAWIGGGEGWKVCQSIPVTRGKWERVSRTFTTGEKETSFSLMLVTDRPTDGIWLDDLSLREGIRPLPSVLEGTDIGNSVDLYPLPPPVVTSEGRTINTRWAPQRWPQDLWAFCGRDFQAEGVATLAATAATGADLEVVLCDKAGNRIAAQREPVPADTRAAFLSLRADIGEQAPDLLVLSIRLSRDGVILATHSGEINLVSPKRVRTVLTAVKDLHEQLRPRVEALEAQGFGAASRVTLTVLDNFIPWVEADLAAEQTDRAWDTATLLESMAERELKRVDDIAAGQTGDVIVPRYATGPLEISHAQTIGTRRFPDGTSERGPVFLTGYGHFGQVRRDVEKFPGYGCNFLQIEFGPSSVLPNETEYADGAIRDFLTVCDRAAAANVAVNLLLSPHYFPGWAMKKWPYLSECHGGFFKYCVHDANARAVIEKSLRYVIPRIKDHPALHSLCLSNEPICVDLTGCRVTATAWPPWLKARHGTIAVLNERWGTEYADFADIPIPKPEIEATPSCLDFIRFNQETFAEFHRWMADVIHEMAPEMPVHAKIMMGAHFRRTLHGFWSVSPELFAGLSQYNGNDAYNMYSQAGPLWSNGWAHIQAGYDFQRSMADMPVFNSENHIITDRDHNAIPPAHLYSELWQNAIHGQSSTTYWVWERTNDHAGSITGSILHRPDDVEALGRCNLDLNRLTHEVAAIQNLAPVTGILYSPSSMVLGKDYDHRLSQTYEAANFLGQPIGFATERMLTAFAESGDRRRPLDSFRVILLPNVTHLPDSARAGLDRLAAAGVKMIAIGDVQSHNDYGRPRTPPAAEVLPGPADSRELHAALVASFRASNLLPDCYPAAADGAPVFGVELRSAEYHGGRVASICNHLREPVTVTLQGIGDGPLRELISDQPCGPTFQTEPMTPLLLAR